MNMTSNLRLIRQSFEEYWCESDLQFQITLTDPLNLYNTMISDYITTMKTTFLFKI